MTDSGVLEDGGGTGGGSGAGGGSAGCQGYAGCTNFTDGTAVTFPLGGNDVYVPKCLRVRAGQQVTFTGNFSDHPIKQACGPAQVSGWSSAVTFTVPGVYGYFCEDHGSQGGSGMSGAIEVVP